MTIQLSEQSLAELIREISEKKSSGSLRLQHEQTRAVVYFEEGHVVYAASNVKSLRLTEYLRKYRLVDEKLLDAYGDKLPDLALATAIADKGLLGRAEIDASLRKVVTDALRLALLWTEGTADFDERARLNEPIRLELDVPTLLLEYARRTETVFATSRFPNSEEMISLGTPSSAPANLLPNEGFLLSRVDGPISVSDLVSISGLREGEAVRAIYGLTLAGFLNRQHWVSALKPGSRPPARKAPPPAPVKPEPPVVPERNEEDDLKDFLTRMDAAVSYYEVLDVGIETAASEIKHAYYGIARKYHPDRFRGKAQGDVHARLESAFARVTHAYETLIDASRRKAYNSKLAAKEKAKDFARSAPTAVSTSTGKSSTKQAGGSVPTKEQAKQTETTFKEGFAALQQGQINLAIGLLAAAARAVPDESRYRAYYGRALAAHEKTRRSAETELQAAVRLAPNNASYRVMLAELYRDLGFARRAIAEAERAQALEPGNAGAKELLRLLK